MRVGELVALLEYFGTLSGIPHEVLGLTVLAWGNSIGDLSTNSAMARRGLSNMAMTACFAGPIFNILTALSVGFMWYLTAEHLNSVPVKLMVRKRFMLWSFYALSALLILNKWITAMTRILAVRWEVEMREDWKSFYLRFWSAIVFLSLLWHLQFFGLFWI